MSLTDLVSSLPGIGSYRGRYAYFSLFASLALVAVAGFGWIYTSGSSEKQITQIEARNTVSGVLIDTLTYLNELENTLQRVIIDTASDDLKDLHAVLARLELSLAALQKSLSERQQPNVKATGELQLDMQRLKKLSEQLIRVRMDVERWFPAQQLMRNEMLYHNQQLQSLLEILMQDMEQDQTQGQRIRGLKLVVDLRHAWLNIISELRLYVANRFGIFTSDYLEAMESRLTNIDYYADEIPDYISQLEIMAEKDQLGFFDVDDIDEIRQHFLAWMGALKKLTGILKNPDWRQDLMLMNDELSPLLVRMRQRLTSLHIDLNTQSARDITQLTEIAKRLSKSILAIAVAGILMILLAYLFLHRNLLKPIAQTAFALKQEAQGFIDIAPPPANLQETKDLVDAFTEMRQQVRNRQRRLDHMAHHDALTQIPNRILFRDRLNHALEMARRGEYLVGLMFLDLDRFKQINDQFGHLVGDELLKVVSERLRSLVRSSDTVARLSGDEFAILIEGLESREGMMPLLEKTLASLERPIHIAEHEMRISASIGIALAPFDDDTAENLIRDADAAMYEAKRNGRANYCFFTKDITHRAKQTLNLEKEVREGVEAAQFLFHYQPVIDRRGNLKCCEALLRWRHGQKGLLSPDIFLDMLDSTGLISSLMNDLLDQTEAFQKQLNQLLGRPVAMSINLSVRLLNDPRFCRGLLERLIAGGFSQGGLVLEITEDILSQELAEADVFLQQVRTLGGHIALDDFGTGQASLSHLRQFPFDLLKIDRVFVHSVDTDPNNASLVEAIIRLAHAFNMPVVAEGVETEAQRAFIETLECDFLQGHLIGMPMESNRLLKLIKASDGRIH